MAEIHFVQIGVVHENGDVTIESWAIPAEAAEQLRGSMESEGHLKTGDAVLPAERQDEMDKARGLLIGVEAAE